MKRPGTIPGVAAALALLLGAASAGASTRVRATAETVLQDASVRIATGGLHTCRVQEDGTVRCWGQNNVGQLGIGIFSELETAPRIVNGISNAVAVTAGADHSCALLADGTARCWGFNDHGQLGDGTTANRFSPVAVSGLSTAVAIAAGSAHSCALLATGTVRCWGANPAGQLGDNSADIDRLTPVLVSSLTNAVAIAAGADSTCVLLADGTARCWGYNFTGGLGDGTRTERHIPVAVSGLSGAVAIAVGRFHACAVLTNGTGRCWGFNLDGQLGEGTDVLERLTPVVVSGLSNAVAITAGTRHTCALLANGTARCWGNNDIGELGDGGVGIDRLAPVNVSGLGNAVAVAAGNRHTCAILASGDAGCWGGNEFGTLGNGTQASSLTVTAVLGGAGTVTARDIAAGRNHTCAVRANGTVACWGANDAGQLGINSSAAFVGSPTPVVSLANVTAIAAGDAHTCALLATGTVRCWGENSSGQLGTGSTGDSRVPVPVVGLSNVIAIAAGGTIGSSHTCALTATGVVRCWGANGSGQLGDGTTVDRLTPVTVRTNTILGEVNLSFVVAIAVGEFHSCAVLSNGSARCWGANGSNQLGNGNGAAQMTAVAVSGLSNAVSIAAGGFHTCATIAVGAPFCWGQNDLGQLGIGSREGRSTPTLVSVDGAIGVAAGFGHSCAITVTGGARCWGDNGSGQVGDSTTLTPALTPMVVKSVRSLAGLGGTFTIANPLTRAVAIAAGRRHTCALLTTGGVSCWGENGAGQLGIGSLIDQPSPVTVPSFLLNIDPSVTLKRRGETTVTILANCEAGARLHVKVTLNQDDVWGYGIGGGECTGGLERYELRVHAPGRDGFVEGAAHASAEALITGRRLFDVQEWTRAVQIVGPR